MLANVDNNLTYLRRKTKQSASGASHKVYPNVLQRDKLDHSLMTDSNKGKNRNLHKFSSIQIFLFFLAIYQNQSEN